MFAYIQTGIESGYEETAHCSAPLALSQGSGHSESASQGHTHEYSRRHNAPSAFPHCLFILKNKKHPLNNKKAPGCQCWRSGASLY